MKIYEALAKMKILAPALPCWVMQICIGQESCPHWERSSFTQDMSMPPYAATSYARASGKVGFATVTCGPGLTRL